MKKKVSLSCTVCGKRNYTTTINGHTQVERFEIKKYCGACQAHTIHKETK